MKLSRKWLNEFVDLPLSEVGDRAFAEAMSVSGSKVEVTEDLSAAIKNVVVGRIVKLEKHPNSDHMLVAQVDALASFIVTVAPFIVVDLVKIVAATAVARTVIRALPKR